MFPISFDMAANDVCGGFASNGCKSAAVAFVGSRAKKTGFNLCRRCLIAWADSHMAKSQYGLQFNGRWFGVMEFTDSATVEDRGRIVAMFATLGLATIWVSTVREYLAANGHNIPAHAIVMVSYTATVEGYV